MERIIRDASERTPFVDFDYPSGQLVMKGESYPENAAAFFGPLIASLGTFLDTLETTQEVKVDLEMAYFNSSTAKAIMNMFQMLEAAAKRGCNIAITWRYHADDDTMAEFGAEFAEDFKAAQFILQTIDAA